MKKTYKLLALLTVLSAGTAMAQTLNTPTIFLPKANATNVAPVSAFIWSKVPTANSYQFKLFKADSSLVLDTLVTDTIFSPQTLNESMSYTWMIRAKNNTDTSVYIHSYFTTKKIDTPSTPSTIAPMGDIFVVTGGGTTSSTVAFNWSAIALASKYHLQVSDDSLFNTLIINDSSYSDNYYKNSTLFNYNKKYFWRVAAKNAGKSTFSKTITFIIPVKINVRPAMVTFISPKNGATNLYTTTGIVWNKSKLATSYRFILKDTLGNIVLQDDSLSSADTSIMAYSLKNGSYYIATVYARNQYGNSEPSFVYFTTERITTAPTKPSFSSKGSMGNAVSYNYSTDANTKKVFVIWSDKKSFDTHLFVDSLSFPSTTNSYYSASNLTLNKWYYVKIIARNTFGTSSALVDSVYNVLPEPTSVYIISPRDSVIKLTPTINWTTSKWATSYKISISTFEKNDTIYKVLRTDTSFVLPAGYLQAGKVYDLYVEAINSVGSSVTHRMIKTTKIPTPPAPVTKKDTVYMQDGPFPTLTWPAVSGATSYCVQIAKDSNFTQLTANDCNITNTNYTITPNSLILGRMEATPTSNFYWRVAATNASGQGVWSTPSKFTVVIVTANEVSTINQTVSVFPNPVQNILTINADVEAVNVKNTSGLVVLQSATNTLDMSNVATGMYFVEFRTKAGATQKVKVIKSE